MSYYAVIGASPFHDTSIACGPYRSTAKALHAAAELTYVGWNTEVVELLSLDWVLADGGPVNDEI